MVYYILLLKKKISEKSQLIMYYEDITEWQKIYNYDIFQIINAVKIEIY